MPKFVFNSCCCCIELRAGCLIMAYLNLIGEILMFAVGILGLAAGFVMVSQGSKDTNKQVKGIGIVVVSVELLIIVFFLLAFTIVLLVGLHKYKRGHIKAYLIFAVIFLVMSFIMSFPCNLRPSDIIKTIVSALLGAFHLLVIRSYYYKMGDNRPAIYEALFA